MNILISLLVNKQLSTRPVCGAEDLKLAQYVWHLEMVIGARVALWPGVVLQVRFEHDLFEWEECVHRTPGKCGNVSDGDPAPFRD